MADEWMYLFQNSIPRLYPLLMRMCSLEFCEYPDFFVREISRILWFLNLTQYDLLLPRKKNAGNDEKADQNAGDQSPKPVREESLEKSGPQTDPIIEKQDEQLRQQQQRLIDMGLKFLDQLFPGAGWLKLSENPDVYPYFQPIFNVPEGFSLVAPENPVQKIVILLYILADLFRGCRSIQFQLDAETESALAVKGDTLEQAIEEWRLYLDLLFEKYYASDLRDLVDHLYTRTDFIHSALGKKLISNLLWQTKYFYLPHSTFITLAKPQYEFAYRPLCLRVSFLQKAFSLLSSRIDQAAKLRGLVQGVKNPWEPYVFDVPDEVSRRLNALYRSQKKTLLNTNASLIKYVAITLSVLDWLINDPASLAYQDQTIQIYRTGGGSAPVFPPPVREDQMELFQQRMEQLERLRTNSRSGG
jgi:hypothetical protein